MLALLPDGVASDPGAADDEELKTAVRTLGYRVVEKAQHLLEYGSPANQLAVIRAIFPPLLYGAREEGKGDQRILEMREQFEKLMGAVREPAGPV